MIDFKRVLITLKSWLPLLGPFIVCLGFIRIHSYYNYFGVYIVSYLEVGEILTSFLNIGMLLATIGIVVVVLYLAFINYKSDFTTIDDLKAKNISVASHIIQSNKGVALYGFVAACFSFIRLYYFYSVEFAIRLVVMVFGALILTLIGITWIELYSKRIFKAPIPYFYILSGIVLITLAVWCSSVTRAMAMKENAPNLRFHLVLDSGQTFDNSKDNYVIGKTQKYVFIYHSEIEEYEVIKMENVKSIQANY